jgi:site-specific recombinase XerD
LALLSKMLNLAEKWGLSEGTGSLCKHIKKYPENKKERFLSNAEIERIHDLRHSFASIAAADGLSLPIIGALLGHSQVSTTARYAHLVGEPLQEAATSIGARIKAIVG